MLRIAFPEKLLEAITKIGMNRLDTPEAPEA